MSGPEQRQAGAAFSPPADLERLQSRAWALGGLGVAASVVGYLTSPSHFFQSYLVAWLFWVGIGLGCSAIMMLHHLSRGAWGIVIRRVLEAASLTVPAMLLLFPPILVGMRHLYPWARPEAATDELIQDKAIYLNPFAFTVRSIFYLAIWGLLAVLLVRMSRRHDRTGEPGLLSRMRTLAAPGLGIYCLLATFAAVDWLMSLEPHWYSSLFGVYVIVGHGLSALAFIIPVALYLSQREAMAGVFQPHHFHDYGKLMLAFVMLWAYIALSQLLIIWSGHLPEEITWYLERGQGGWKWLSIGLALFHFLLPFLLLLSRDVKRDARALAAVALLVLAMRWVDLYWLAAPSFQQHGLGLHWLDLATLVGVGGLWLGFFFRQLQGASLLPPNDPALEEALSHD